MPEPDFPKLHHRLLAALALGIAGLLASLILFAVVGLVVDVPGIAFTTYVVFGVTVGIATVGVLRPSVANSVLMFLAHTLVSSLHTRSDWTATHSLRRLQFGECSRGTQSGGYPARCTRAAVTSVLVSMRWVAAV
jgi:hypothetical protein